MHRHTLLLATIFLVLLPLARIDAAEPSTDSSSNEFSALADTDWPWWRGPTRNGVAPAGQTPPLEWSETKNVLWMAKVPGRGHGSPTVVGDRVFLASAEKEKQIQSVICYDRSSGRRLWKTGVHQGGFTKKGNSKSTLASSTVACDGERLFINFINGGALHTTALSADGRVLWQQKISDYVVHQGYGASPALFGSQVIVTADNKGGGAIAALGREDGEIVWKHERPETPNYSSPIILSVAGREQLLMTGCELVAGFDPGSGKRLWQIEGATTECVTSTVTDGSLIYTSGGYPKNHISAVRADGSGKLVWENKTRVYVPSMLVAGDSLYAVTDAGVAICFEAATGRECWKHRLGGTFSSSPVLVGENIVVTNERGKTFVFKAQSDKFERVAENQLGDEVFATPAICGNRIYTRVALRKDGKRREMLYCLGKEK